MSSGKDCQHFINGECVGCYGTVKYCEDFLEKEKEVKEDEQETDER